MLEQLSFDTEEFVETKDLYADVKGEVFSCCYRYRECSDNKGCVISNNPDSMYCSYRKNLESGNILYGKNANNFIKKEYDDWVSLYRSLDNKTLYELNCIITYYERYRYGMLCRNSTEIEKLVNLGFITTSIPKMDILKKCSNNTFKGILNKSALEELKQNAREKRGNRAQPKKEEFVEYILNNPSPEFDAFAKRFAYVIFSNAFKAYVFEFFYEFIDKDNVVYIKEPLYF